MKNIELFKRLNGVVYQFLEDFNPSLFNDGRYELENGVYVNIEAYTTQERKERKFESHKKYIDVQYMIDGEELITVVNESELIISESYNEERDITFYNNEPKGIDFRIANGEFIILKPGDAHMPCICIGEKKRVRKAVIKIPFDDFGGQIHET